MTAETTIPTTMRRFRRVARLWNWLPAFRGVAEHQSIHRAATALGVSPSALSRMVKLLEADLGQSLFVRHPGGLRLTGFGSTLLTVTRNAMRMVDDGIDARDGSAPLTPVKLGATSDLAGAVLARALTAVGGLERVAQVTRVLDNQIVHELLQGNLDAAITGGARASSDLVSARLGTARSSVFGAADHPLARGRRRVSLERLRAAQFVALSTEPDAVAGVPGTVVTWSNSPELARIVCESSRLLCVLPDAAVHPGARGRLVRLAPAAAAPIYLVRRVPLPGREPGIVELIAAEIRRALA